MVLAPDELTDERLAWPVVGTRVLGQGVITTLRQDDVEAPDHTVIKREYLDHPGAVSVIALDAQHRVALVRQYRHPVRHRLVEPPAGLLDIEGENYLVAAQRELAEEVGLAAQEWRVLVDVFSTPGIISESLRIFLARELSVTQAPDGFIREGEEAQMDIVWASLADLVDAVLAGRLHNPSLVSGTLAAWISWQRDRFASLRPADAPWPAREAVAEALKRR